MDKNQLHIQVVAMRQSLFDQAYLDEQFVQLEELQDEMNPNFVEEVVTLFYKDSARLLNNMEQAMDRSSLDFARLDNFMHQFKGSCSRCIKSFQQPKREYATLKKKLEAYFQSGKTSRTKGDGDSSKIES